MGGIRGFLKSLKKSRKKQVLFFSVSMAIICISYVICLLGIKVHNKRKDLLHGVVVRDYHLLVEFENAEIIKNEIILEGWVARLNSKNTEIIVLLQETNTTKERSILSTDFSKENNVNLADMNWETGTTGFKAIQKTNLLNQDTCYELLLELTYEEIIDGEVEENRKKISSGQYLYQGEIYQYNPLTYEKPKLKDKYLETIITGEQLVFQNEEIGCWVYQKGGTLYFIANENFGLTGNRDRRMKLHFYTNQIDLLPKDRQQYGFESCDFYFDEKEYSLEEISNYHVAVIQLPSKYMVSMVEMGIYEVGGAMLKDIVFSIRN